MLVIQSGVFIGLTLKIAKALTMESLNKAKHGQQPKRFLFYLEQDYSFAVLRPLQSAAHKRGHEVRWLLVENASRELLEPNEELVPDISSAIAYNPDAVFAPGDQMPGFIPGLKVQVFHGTQ